MWPLFIKGRMEHVCFKLRFRMACAENMYEISEVHNKFFKLWYLFTSIFFPPPIGLAESVFIAVIEVQEFREAENLTAN